MSAFYLGALPSDRRLMPAPDWTFLAEVSLWQVAIVITACWVIVRLLIQFWPWLKRVIALTDALGQLPAFIERTSERIEDIHHEVHYNNGSSVKDGLHRVELGVKGLYDRADESDKKLADHIDQSSGWKDRLEELERTQPPKEEP